jgi:hypothetical protein
MLNPSQPPDFIIITVMVKHLVSKHDLKVRGIQNRRKQVEFLLKGKGKVVPVLE